MFILPINRDMDVVRTPRAVVALVILNSVFLVLTYALASPAQVFKSYGFTPAHPRLLTILAAMFLHAGFWHLAGNMWFLWMFGKEVENSIGMWLFTLVYLLCGLGGAFLHYLFNIGSTIPCVGASGAISGIAGCFFILFPKADFDLVVYFGWIRLKTFKSHTKAAVGAWIGEQTLLGLLSQAAHFSSTAFWAHIGGFAVGLAAATCFKWLVPLNSEGVPIVRPWFVPAETTKESEEITRLKL